MSTNRNLFQEKGEPKRNRTEALLLTSLTSYRGAKSAHNSSIIAVVVILIPYPTAPVPYQQLSSRSFYGRGNYSGKKKKKTMNGVVQNVV